MSSSEFVPIVETQVKERLTGAVILVALIVLLVPELLTGGPGSPGKPQTEAGASAAESAMRTVHIDLVEGGVRQSQPAEADLSARALHKPAPDPEAALAKAEEAAAATAEGNAQTVERPDAAMTSEVDAADAAKRMSAAPASEQPAPAVVRPVLRAANTTTVQPAKATIAPQPSPQHKMAAASGPGWAVQLGSFKSRDNAQRLVKQLKGKGYSAYVLGGGGGKLYKVRVGPQPDKGAAATLAAKLRSAGFAGSVVPQS